jgi:hypothetical protein
LSWYEDEVENAVEVEVENEVEVEDELCRANFRTPLPNCKLKTAN